MVEGCNPQRGQTPLRVVEGFSVNRGQTPLRVEAGALHADARRIDLADLAGFDRPAPLTNGTRSAPFFARVVDMVAEPLPSAERGTIDGADHVPHSASRDGTGSWPPRSWRAPARRAIGDGDEFRARRRSLGEQAARTGGTDR